MFYTYVIRSKKITTGIQVHLAIYGNASKSIMIRRYFLQKTEDLLN